MRIETDEDRERLAWLLWGWLMTLPWLAPPVRPRPPRPPMDELRQAAEASFTALCRRVREQLVGLADLYESGRITAEEFADRMQGTLGQAYSAAGRAAAAAAGRPEASIRPAEEQFMREQEFIDKLLSDLRQGAVSPARLRVRLDMYVDGIREAYNRVWAEAKGSTVYRWFMHPRAVHCAACLEAASGSGRGLPPGVYRLEELPFFPGRSPICLTNCKCWLQATDGSTSAPQIREPEEISGETFGEREI